MGDIVPFKKAQTTADAQGKTLCRRGFHKWRVATESRFDVKRGRLATRYRCQRCGAEKTQYT